MNTKQVELTEKTYTVHELLATEFDETQKVDNDVDRIVLLIKKSANMTDEEYNKITLRERSKIMDAVNELNGWADNPNVKVQEKNV